MPTISFLPLPSHTTQARPLRHFANLATTHPSPSLPRILDHSHRINRVCENTRWSRCHPACSAQLPIDQHLACRHRALPGVAWIDRFPATTKFEHTCWIHICLSFNHSSSAATDSCGSCSFHSQGFCRHPLLHHHAYRHLRKHITTSYVPFALHRLCMRGIISAFSAPVIITGVFCGLPSEGLLHPRAVCDCVSVPFTCCTRMLASLFGSKRLFLFSSDVARAL